MGDATNIEWTDATWNVMRGCSHVSPGCAHCYAERDAVRQIDTGYKGLVKIGAQGRPTWTGKVVLVEHLLDHWIRKTKPQLVFVNSMSDVAHESLSKHDIAQVFAAMAVASWHTFQLLTKRAQRLHDLLNDDAFKDLCFDHTQGGMPLRRGATWLKCRCRSRRCSCGSRSRR